MASKSCLYWIRLPEHTDIFSQGYVGVAKNGAKLRWSSHKTLTKNGSQLPIHRAIRKYGGRLIYEEIVKAPIEYCLDLESKLRSSPCIGWNVAKGGEKSPTAGFAMSAATKEKIAASKRGKRLHDSALNAAKLYWSSVPPWEIHSSNSDIWLQAVEIQQCITSLPEATSYRIAKKLGFRRSSIEKIFKKIKSGWNPLQDEDWLNFRRSKLTPDALENKPVKCLN